MKLSRTLAARTPHHDLRPILRCKSIEAAKAMEAHLKRSHRKASRGGFKAGKTAKNRRNLQ